MNLISNTEFGKSLIPGEMPKEIFESWKKSKKEYPEFYLNLRRNYDDFISKDLKLEMFVPCDEEGNVLKEPTEGMRRTPVLDGEITKYFQDYNKAKEKVLFEGFTYNFLNELNRLKSDSCAHIFIDFNDYFNSRGFILIEDLLHNTHRICNNLTLTNSALKQIGL